MKVIIQGDKDMTLTSETSEQIDDENFVDMVIGEEAHTIKVFKIMRVGDGKEREMVSHG